MVNLIIDNKSITAKEGTTILDAARANGINIPTLCYLKDINDIGACRICVVETEGTKQMFHACATPVSEGMVVHTNSKRVRSARRQNLALILSQHDSNCPTCIRNGNCTLQNLARDFNLGGDMFEKDVPVNNWCLKNELIRTESKCVKCMRCVQVCDKVQSLGIWDVKNTGSRTTVAVSLNRNFKDSDCSLCGQCITHCPTGALTARDDTERVFDAIADSEKTTVVQVAPAVRAAWAEELGLPDDENTTKRMVAALKALGFDYVFDTNFSADLTIMEEGSELIERLKNRENAKMPMFTSCCPGWVRFLKSQYPELCDNLSTAKSPQQMFGAVAKSFFAEKIGVDPHNMFVASVMPCVAKKAECAEENQNDACGDPDVDVALTTREFVRMIRENHIDVASLPDSEFDSPLGEGTGAAVIFGTTGGVMVAALRSAYYLVTGKNPDPDLFSALTGGGERREAEIEIPGFGKLKVAVTSGLANARALCEDVKNGKASYDFVEIMACPGGCAGGGGQPIHDGEERAKSRGNKLMKIDSNMKTRFSHENKEVNALYKNYLEKPLSEKSHHLLHTDHHGWKMPLAPEKK